MDKTELKEIAKIVRDQVKDYIESEEEWFNYSSEELQGACGIASVVLAKTFNRLGIPATAFMGTYNQEDHCWVVSNGIIFDITASQFKGLPKVLVADVVKSKRAKAYQTMKEIDLNNPISSFDGWPDHQKPLKLVLNQILTY